MENIRRNPVRIYSVAVAILALVAQYVPELPTALILGVIAAIIGTGEVVRSKVVPLRDVEPNVQW
jgi:hypothetical protein